jgi:ubiquinone/menaquinone biosynthesis C-methylase UbiE
MKNITSHIIVSDSTLERMKDDWNARARQNSKWFINTVNERQSDREFDLNDRQEVQNLVSIDQQLLTTGRDPRKLRLLEIGCGIGRMTRRLAEIFGEVYATDVSGEMILQGKQRLHDCTNVIFKETNGVDFRSFDDKFFDVIFCGFVYQHIPSADVIRANLSDAFRVLQPGGVFKFQTNSVTNEEFNKQPKDTWTGDTLGEHDIRSLARELDAQMIRLTGAGTQYCWTIWRRKKVDSPMVGAQLSEPKLLPVRTTSQSRSLLIAGLDANSADINNITIRLGQSAIEPFYIGPAIGCEESNHFSRIDFDIPENEPSGPCPLTILVEDGSSSPAIALEVPLKKAQIPSILIINNGKDGGSDIETTGAKSHVRLFVEKITSWPDWENLEVLVGQIQILPFRISFVPGNGLHMVEFMMPNIRSGIIPIALSLGDRRSDSMDLKVKSEPFLARLRRQAPGSRVLHVIKWVKKSRTKG